MVNRPVEIRYKAKKFRVAEFGKRLAELPRKLRRPVLIVFSEYMVKQFKLYPRYKEVARRKAYPEVNGFFSDRQRRFVMAAIADGRIQPGSPHRSQELKRGWKINGKDAEDIRSITIVNDAPAAVFAYHPIYQARQLGLVGWKNIDDMAEENTADALLEAEVWIINNADKVLDSVLK